MVIVLKFRMRDIAMHVRLITTSTTLANETLKPNPNHKANLNGNLVTVTLMCSLPRGDQPPF